MNISAMAHRLSGLSYIKNVAYCRESSCRRSRGFRTDNGIKKVDTVAPKNGSKSSKYTK